MLIDWFTVGAQALNFLILIGLLKRFLYGPILNAIDAREERIAKELADADAKKAEAQKERDEFQHKNEAFDQQRDVLLAKTSDEAKAERLPAEVCARFDTATELSDEDRKVIVEIARHALAGFQPKRESNPESQVGPKPKAEGEAQHVSGSKPDVPTQAAATPEVHAKPKPVPATKSKPKADAKE